MVAARDGAQWSFGQRRRQMVGRIVAIVLIVVGAVLVSNNLGLTRLSIREIAATWWPVLLIIGGLSLLLRRRGR
jgi:lipopolysaccharide export LptBFGC system permease protein LptF